MAEVADEIEQVAAAAQAELSGVKDAQSLEQWRIKYLGTKGKLKDLMTLLGKVPREQKPAIGQKVNAVKGRLTELFEATQAQLAAGGDQTQVIDVTEPGKKPELGNGHILNKVVGELTELFGRMGFSVAQGPELEDEFHNFVALNIPKSHPARDPLDNFYVNIETDENIHPTPSVGSPGPQEHALLLRTQTSTVQIRVMETTKPPIRVVIPGKVYRPDTVDDTHLFQFNQLEALVVDENVTMVDLKSTVMQFVHAYFGAETKVRFRPSFFPFTEPSAEVDVYFEDKQRWVELGGCGMVHPNVLTACNIDPEKYSGWAFGFGIERIAMRKYAINDIRLFVENDLRFLRQF
jgi:phenylalanyl-tRNA synthetase alpha chain